MDVKVIRDEISKIDSMLANIDDELAMLNQDDSEDVEIFESEIMGILGALSNAPITTTPFSSLMDEGVLTTITDDSVVLDAFTFFGLIQAFSEDETVMRSLCKIFPSVYNVTITQLEDSLLFVDRIVSDTVRNEFIAALLGRLVSESSASDDLQKNTRMKQSIPLIVCKCCEMMDEEILSTNQALVALFRSPNFNDWPIGVKVQIVFSLKANPALSSDIFSFVESVSSALSEDNSSVSVETKVLWQLIEIGTSVGNVAAIAPLVNPIKIMKSTSGPTDVHKLIIALDKLADSLIHNGGVPSIIWQSAVEKLGTTGMAPVFEVTGTLNALGKARISSDIFFQNVNLFKRKISSSNLSNSEFEEIVNYLVLVGDKTPQSVITKAIMERRDLFVPSTSGGSEDVKTLVSVLALSVVASLDSGSIIPESILLLKKFAPQIIASSATVEDLEIVACLFSVLLPNMTISDWPTIYKETTEKREAERSVESVLELLGFKIDSTKIFGKHFLDQSPINVDFSIPLEKQVVVIEQKSVFNISSKRPILCGPTALKISVLATRRNFKVIVVIPELYPDDKSLMQLFSEPMRRIPTSLMNTDLLIDSLDDAIMISQNIRIGKIVFGKSIGIVDISKILFSILKLSVFVAHFDFSKTFCNLGDQFLSLLMADFLSTFAIKHKLTGVRIDFRNCPHVTVSGLVRLFESLHSMASGLPGGIGGPLRVSSDLSAEDLSSLAAAIVNFGFVITDSPSTEIANSVYLG